MRDIMLDRFSQDEAGALTRYVTGSAEMSAEMLAEIIGHAEGIPLYIEELTRAALETGEAPVRGDAAAPRIEPSVRLSVPGAVRASLISPFDRLGRTTLEVAQVASVLGREFSSDMVQHVLCWDDAAALESSLRDLGSAGLVFRRQPDQ
jgi:predicted ATPase